MRYQYVVMLCALPGREAEFDDWYDNKHLADVAAVEGVVSAARYNIDFQRVTGFADQPWRSLAIYELEADDPIAVAENIRALAGTEAMPYRGAETKQGMVQIMASAAGVPRGGTLRAAQELPPGWRKTEPLAE
jgi:hypothetical protein